MPLPDPPAAGAGLLERSTEIDAARRALSEAADGDGRLLVIVGPAGIGKTRLLDATRQLAEDRGVRVLTARGGRLERDFAYGVVRQLLERVVAGATPAAREALLAGPAAHAGRALGLDVGGEDEVRVADDQAFVVRTACTGCCPTSRSTGRCLSPSTMSSGPTARRCACWHI